MSCKIQHQQKWLLVSLGNGLSCDIRILKKCTKDGLGKNLALVEISGTALFPMSVQWTHLNHQFPKHLIALPPPFLYSTMECSYKTVGILFYSPSVRERETTSWTTLRSIAVFANSDLYEFKADCGYLRGLTENKSVIRVKTRKIRDFHVFLWSNYIQISIMNHIYMPDSTYGKLLKFHFDIE